MYMLIGSEQRKERHLMGCARARQGKARQGNAGQAGSSTVCNRVAQSAIPQP